MGQISPVAAGSAFVAQAQPRQGLAPVAFQANGGGLSFAQVARTEQISQDLSSGGAPVEMAFLGFGLDLGNYHHSGTGALSMEDANGNVLQQDWRGEGNLQFASQQGTGNRAVQQQYGARNMAILFQRGTMNVGEVLQLSDQGVVTLLQNGDRNSASVTQATAGSFASISQTGVANIVAVRQ
ncbi:hypothetical protein [Sphingobium bisphenolivorans]|uniref:hypothetical protein n=1 Tax=Sphingobium bisphenolivorans TaxID=1335760 RepID=UPI00039C99CE|nr:hypothetical protein [Sphingobium bisphenolivorans]